MVLSASGRAGPDQGMGPRPATALSLSVIIPAFNEADSLDSILSEMHRVVGETVADFELIVVDDGSRDRTAQVAMNAARRLGRVKVVAYSPNRGKGFAIRAGLFHADKRVVGYVDADLRFTSEELRPFMDALAQDAHVAVANKWDPTSQVEYTFTRRFLSYGYAVFARLLFRIPLFDTQTGFKFFRREVLTDALPKVRTDRFGFDIELLAHVVAANRIIRALPIVVREVRPSSVTWVEALKMFKDLALARIRLWKGGPLLELPQVPAASVAEPDTGPPFPLASQGGV